MKVYCIFNKSGVHRTRRASRQSIILMLILFHTSVWAMKASLAYCHIGVKVNTYIYVHVLEYYNFISSDVIFPAEINRYIGPNTGVWHVFSPFPSCQCLFTFCIDLNSKLPPFDQILNKLVPENAKCVYYCCSGVYIYALYILLWNTFKILTRPGCFI